ncbi:hypothetical protein F4801DRAFT_470345 [Xylaria longipes]|nr:hypothetical protein F4801DRAFT_470345 [Xylaria longipes]
MYLISVCIAGDYSRSIRIAARRRWPLLFVSVLFGSWCSIHQKYALGWPKWNKSVGTLLMHIAYFYYLFHANKASKWDKRGIMYIYTIIRGAEVARLNRGSRSDRYLEIIHHNELFVLIIRVTK